MCRCNNANMTIGQIVSDFGKIPVRARQEVNIVHAIAQLSPDAADPCSAWASGGHNDIAIQGPCQDRVSVYAHEVGHIVDWVVLGNNTEWWSEGTEWKDVVFKDTCVSDSYALNEWADNFAQVFVLAMFNYNVQNILKVHPELKCMTHAINKGLELTEDLLNDKFQHNKCDRAAPYEPEVICMGPEARKQGKCESIPQFMFDNAETLGVGSKLDPFAGLTPEQRAKAEKTNKAIFKSDSQHGETAGDVGSQGSGHKTWQEYRAHQAGF